MASMTMNHAAKCSSLPQQLRKEGLALQRKHSVGITRIAGRKSLPAASWSPRQESAASAVQKGVEEVLKGLVAAAATAVVVLAPAAGPALADTEFTTYYGTAASASSYGGYGGNTSKKDSAEYVYDVPDEWKERAISKVEKGTNGTDSEFYNPKKRTEKTYLLFLAGFRRLPPKDNVLNDIALSDVDLQAAESKVFTEKEIDGQKYYDFDIDAPIGHVLISITSAKNKLYAHFVNAKPAEWQRDEAILRRIHDSFKTVGRDPLAPPGQF